MQRNYFLYFRWHYLKKCIYILDSAYTKKYIFYYFRWRLCKFIYILDSAYTNKYIYVLDSAYTERYLGTANDSPEGYDVSILH